MKLTSVAFTPRYMYKYTLMKIMMRPVMESKFDYRNDAYRVALLTIDIREHQDYLMCHGGLSNGTVQRHLHLLQVVFASLQISSIFSESAYTGP